MRCLININLPREYCLDDVPLFFYANGDITFKNQQYDKIFSIIRTNRDNTMPRKRTRKAPPNSIRVATGTSTSFRFEPPTWH